MCCMAPTSRRSKAGSSMAGRRDVEDRDLPAIRRDRRSGIRTVLRDRDAHSRSARSRRKTKPARHRQDLRSRLRLRRRLGAWRRFDRSNTYTDAHVESFKTEWRTQHAATVRFWHRLGRHLAPRASAPGDASPSTTLPPNSNDGTLYLTLPSGRRLAYPEAHLEPGKFGHAADCLQGQCPRRLDRSPRLVRHVLGKCGASRGARSARRQPCSASKRPAIRSTLHCHDEAVCEAPEDFGKLDEFLG